jgi:hypothetical protein
MIPEKRPMNALYTINEYQRHSDDEDEDEQDAAKEYTDDCAVTVNVGGLAAAVPAKQIASHRQQKNADSLGSTKSRSDWDTAGWSSSSPRQEYFLLPLSKANVARHAATVS